MEKDLQRVWASIEEAFDDNKHPGLGRPLGVVIEH